MLVTRFNPYREMNDFRHAFDRMMSFERDGMDRSITAFSPAVNTREGDYAYHVEVDLPGVKKEDIDININDGYITLSGERNIKNELKEENYYKVESEYGRFERSFSLPEGVDVENIHAESSDGVLEVVLPKLEVVHEAPVKIEIK
jgi:HSP20 family protein